MPEILPTGIIGKRASSISSCTQHRVVSSLNDSLWPWKSIKQQTISGYGTFCESVLPITVTLWSSILIDKSASQEALYELKAFQQWSQVSSRREKTVLWCKSSLRSLYPPNIQADSDSRWRMKLNPTASMCHVGIASIVRNGWAVGMLWPFFVRWKLRCPDEVEHRWYASVNLTIILWWLFFDRNRSIWLHVPSSHTRGGFYN